MDGAACAGYGAQLARSALKRSTGFKCTEVTQ